MKGTMARHNIRLQQSKHCLNDVRRCQICVIHIMWTCLFSGADPCTLGHDCQHICVKSDDSYICRCREGYTLNPDKKTCSSKNLEVFMCLRFASESYYFKCLSIMTHHRFYYSLRDLWLMYIEPVRCGSVCPGTWLPAYFCVKLDTVCVRCRPEKVLT